MYTSTYSTCPSDLVVSDTYPMLAKEVGSPWSSHALNGRRSSRLQSLEQQIGLFTATLSHSFIHSMYQKVKKVGSDVFDEPASGNHCTRLHATTSPS